MPEVTLIPHPSTRCDTVRSLRARADRSAPGVLSLRYVLAGDIAQLRLPVPVSPRRTDELWRHTCFEAFVSADGSSAYCEFNLSPSSAWAAYRFDAYRSGMAALDLPAPPVLERTDEPERLTVVARIVLPAALSAAALRLALCTVIEDRDGRLSYWAQHHPAAKPDFHHGDVMTVRL